MWADFEVALPCSGPSMGSCTALGLPPGHTTALGPNFVTIASAWKTFAFNNRWREITKAKSHHARPEDGSGSGHIATFNVANKA